jgi:hypothetical protein
MHNKNEEIEHASMVLEWIRRHNLHFDQMLRRYLFTDEPITGIEKAAGADAADAPPPALGIGSMKKGK